MSLLPTTVKSQAINLTCRLIITVFFAVVFSSCRNNAIDREFHDIIDNQLSPIGITISYPKEGTIFPPEFPPPTFVWNDTLKKPEQWHIWVSGKSGKIIHSGIVRERFWRPDSILWQDLKTESANNPLNFTIIGSGRGISVNKYRSGSISFSFSTDSVGADIFYREVPLPFSYAVKNVQEIEWYTGSISGGSPRKVLNNIPVCGNCHSFSRDGLIAMDIDYANDKGSYIITPLTDTVHLSLDKIITWSDYKRDEKEATYGLLSQISPDGRFVLSTVKDRSVFVAIDNLEYSQLFFPVKGIIGVYNRQTKSHTALPGASDKKYVQSNPIWSPDSREVLFARSNSYMNSKIEKSESILLDQEDAIEFISGQKEFKFDIYRIPFNGGNGGKSAPVEGASGNDKSNYFAKYSPDGKWIVFCQAENFMLLQPDSKLYIMPAAGGKPRLMNCNSENMNSWHSWSPNSRWLVFSSKRRGPYTQLYITHIDQNGNDSPAVFLENLAFEDKAANIPEFFDNSMANLRLMTDEFSDNAMYHNRLANLNIKDKNFIDALINVENAIKADSTFYEAYKNKLYLNMLLGRSGSKEDLDDKQTALRVINRKIIQNPSDASLVVKRGELRLLMDDYDGAMRDGLDVIKSNPKNYSAYNLAATTCQKTGDINKAIQYLNKVQKLQPDNAQISFTLANLFKVNRQMDASLAILNSLIEKDPNEAGFYLSRASIYLMQNRITDAKNDYDKAISVAPENYICYRERGLFRMHNTAPDLARKDIEKAGFILDEKIRKNPQDATLLTAHAEIMEQLGNIQGALNDYETYLKTWPDNSSILQKEGEIYFTLKEWQKSIDAYTAVIENFTEDAKIFFRRGLSFQQNGNLAEALNDLSKAVQLEPESYAYHYFRAMIRTKMGDSQGLVKDLETAEKLLKTEQLIRKLDKTELDLLTTIQKQLTSAKR